MPIRAIFTEGIKELTVSGLHQWDYGQKLEIRGLALPALIEVHFACLNMTEAVVRIGTTVDGVTTVAIPDGCLEHDTPLRAWVYVIDTVSGKTERTIHLPIAARTKPQGADSRQPFVVDEYAEAIDKINKTVEGWRDGIVDQNDGGKTKIWTGTREEFNALEAPDDHTMYVITDELPDYTEFATYLEAIQNGDEAVPKATQAHYSMDGHSLNEMGALCDCVRQVKDGEEPVPKATQAHYDMSGRGLNGMCYIGGKFQKLANRILPGEGVYQIVMEFMSGLDTNGQETKGREYFPFVVWYAGMAADGFNVSYFPGPGKILKLNSDGSFDLLTDGKTFDADAMTFYARLVAPFAGW